MKRFLQFVTSPTHSRTLSLLAFLVILTAIPLTVFIAQQQQEIRQRAEEKSCPDLCFADQLWINIHPENGSCTNTNAKEVYTCKKDEQNTQNTITCGGQPFYCNGSDWTSGARPQAPTATPIPTSIPPPVGEPTAVPPPAGEGAQPPAPLQTCIAEGHKGFCANTSGQFPPNQQFSCGAQDFTKAPSGDSSCTNKNYPSCYICPLSDVSKPTSTPTKSAPTATPTPTPRSGGPTATSTPVPPGAGPTATPPPASGPTGTRIAGDINGDDRVNIADYSILASCFGTNANTPSCGTNKTKADLNNDGKVDGVDYNILIRNFGK